MDTVTGRIISGLYNSPLDAIAWSLRSLICAAPGHRLLCADYSNIEGRVLAFLAGEEWKLEAFRQYDTIIGEDDKGEPLRAGPDLYKLAYAKAFGLLVESVTKDQRQIGKVMELALGYQGAHGAFLSMIKNYSVVPWLRRNGPTPVGIKLSSIADTVQAAVPGAMWDDALFLYWQGAQESAEEVLAHRRIEAQINEWLGEELTEWDEPDLFDVMAECAKKNRHDLEPNVWAALRIVVDGWRQAHTATVKFWRALEDASIAAVESPGKAIPAGERIKFQYAGDFLYARLPSGRCLAYPYARVVQVKNKWSNRPTRKLVFEGLDPKTKRWGTQSSYGGMLAENMTQAVSYDVLAQAKRRLKQHGYRMPLHVHDEIVAEMPNGVGDLNEMCALMSKVNPWAEGLPVTVAGWEGARYRK